jgi:hypothetical protein
MAALRQQGPVVLWDAAGKELHRWLFSISMPITCG